MEFEEPILQAANVYLAGWSRNSAAPSSAVAIHHPQGDEKRISFENDPLSVTSLGGDSGSGSTHIRVADWDLGTTEVGSSGSPLFDPAKRIIGQLHGGFASCGNDSADWYGRFAVSWDGASANPASNLKSWLNPGDSSPLTLDGQNNVVLLTEPIGFIAEIMLLLLEDD